MGYHEIAQARQQLGLTRADMARLLGVSPRKYVDWERGLARVSALEMQTVQQLAATQMRPVMGAEAIREARRALGLTQVALAAALAVHPLTVTRWETGTRRIGRRHGLLLATLLKEKTRS